MAFSGLVTFMALTGCGEPDSTNGGNPPGPAFWDPSFDAFLPEPDEWQDADWAILRIENNSSGSGTLEVEIAWGGLHGGLHCPERLYNLGTQVAVGKLQCDT